MFVKGFEHFLLILFVAHAEYKGIFVNSVYRSCANMICVKIFGRKFFGNFFLGNFFRGIKYGFGSRIYKYRKRVAVGRGGGVGLAHGRAVCLPLSLPPGHGSLHPDLTSGINAVLYGYAILALFSAFCPHPVGR